MSDETRPQPTRGWTADTLKEYTDMRFLEMNTRFSLALADTKDSIEKIDTEMIQRFDGVDQNLDRVIKTVSERTGSITLLQRLVPNMIAIASIVALIFVSRGK